MPRPEVPPNRVFCEQASYGIAVCGHRASVAVVPFSGPDSGPQNGTGNWAHGRGKTATVVSNFWRLGLGFCASVGPLLVRPSLAHAQTSTSPASRPKSRNPRRRKAIGEALAWRARLALARHMTANSTVSPHCPPEVVPRGGPVLGTVLSD